MARATNVPDLLAHLGRLLDEGLPEGVMRRAVLDADGTLWGADHGLEAMRTQARHGLLQPEVRTGPLAAWIGGLGLALPDDADLAMEALIRWIEDGTFDEVARRTGRDVVELWADVWAMHAWIYAGCREVDVEAHGERVWRDVVKASVFPETAPLLEGLAALGLEPTLVSASPEPILRAAAAELGIPRERVLGMATDVDDEGRLLARVPSPTWGPGKVRALDERVGPAPVRPLFAAGDSVAGGDRPLLERALVRVAVRPQGVHKAAADVDDELWLLG